MKKNKHTMHFMQLIIPNTVNYLRGVSKVFILIQKQIMVAGVSFYFSSQISTTNINATCATSCSCCVCLWQMINSMRNSNIVNFFHRV